MVYQYSHWGILLGVIGAGDNRGTADLKSHQQDTKSYQNDTILKRDNNNEKLV